MNIPRTFRVAHKKYTVKFATTELTRHKPALIGQCDFVNHIINLSKKEVKDRRDRADIEQTYLHELWHAIWDVLGETKLCNDEQKAEAFCGILLQALNSSKGKIGLAGKNKQGRKW